MVRTIKTGAAAMAVVGFVDYKSQFYKVSHNYLLLNACILCLFLSGTVERVLWCEKFLRLANLRVLCITSGVVRPGCVEFKSLRIKLGVDRTRLCQILHIMN
jgi:hypothetical protein